MDQRSKASRKLSRRLRRLHENDPIAELVKECKDFIERSTRRVNKLKAELESETGLLEDGRVRLARLNAQQATPVGEPVAGCGPSSTLQQMGNQLRRSRASKGRPWCGDGPPDVSAIPPMPDHLQGLEVWLNLRNCELRDALEFGSPDVIARLSHLLSQDPGAMEVHPATRMSALIDATDAKRRCLDGGH